MIRNTCPKCKCGAYIKLGKEKTKYKELSEPVYKERRQCKYCGTKYTVEPKERNNPICPYCNSIRTRKEGFSKSGKRKYMCTNCKKHFQLEYENLKRIGNKIPEHDRKMIQIYHNGGYSNKFISKLLSVGETSVKRILNKNNTLSKLKQDITRYSLTHIEGIIYKELYLKRYHSRSKEGIVSINSLLCKTNSDKDTLRVHVTNLKKKLANKVNSSNIVNISSVYGKGYKINVN